MGWLHGWYGAGGCGYGAMVGWNGDYHAGFSELNGVFFMVVYNQQY